MRAPPHLPAPTGPAPNPFLDLDQRLLEEEEDPDFPPVKPEGPPSDCHEEEEPEGPPEGWGVSDLPTPPVSQTRAGGNAPLPKKGRIGVFDGAAHSRAKRPRLNPTQPYWRLGPFRLTG